MNLIKNSQTNEVLWYGPQIAFASNGAYRTTDFGLGIAEANATYVENVAPVDYFFVGAYAYDNGWSIMNQDAYDEGMNAIKDKAAQEVRAKRDVLLQQSDWTQLPDVTISNKAAWATYREELRNISGQAGFPLNVTWPVAPVVPASNQPTSSGTQEV